MTDHLPDVVPPLERTSPYKRSLPMKQGVRWLQQGIADFSLRPLISLAYGCFVLAVSAGLIFGLFISRRDYILLPVLAGFLVVGPAFALGLYEKSRRIESGTTVRLRDMVFVRPASGSQIFFAGALLCLLFLVWLRAAVIIYALFFGIQPFPGMQGIALLLVGSPVGWAILLVGGGVGALFAAFSFAIGVVSLPMMLNERTDALTAMGTSLALTANNLPAMLIWGGIVLAGFILSILTGLLGMIVFFPIAGHSTWHVYRSLRSPGDHE